MSTLTKKTRRWLLAFLFANSCAEMVQAVAMAWATFALTANATLVGLVNAAAYLPGVLAGFYFQRHADRGRASRLLVMTNWALLIGSLALAIIWILIENVSFVVTTIIVVQCSLSLIKLFNKAYVGRFVREHFENTDAAKVLSRGASFGLIGGLVGGVAAGVLLDAATAAWCFALAATFYLFSQIAIRYAAGDSAIEKTATAMPKQPRQNTPSEGSADTGVTLRIILIFSIPSSGALPFISTLMAPLANKVSPGSGAFYSVLTVAAMCGGFIAGMVISTGHKPLATSLRYALLAGAVASPLFAITHSVVSVIILMLTVSVILTSHVISMQVLTNQSAPQGKVGRSMVLRNSVAGTAKGVFSLGAGVIADAYGLSLAWFVLAITLATFGVLWPLLSRRYNNSVAAL